MRRQLQQRRRADPDRKAGIAAFERMADPVGFAFVEEDDLVGLRHRLAAAQMMHVNPPIGEHQVSRGSAFLCALVPACARARDVPNQKRAGDEISHVEDEPRGKALVTQGGKTVSTAARRSASRRMFFASSSSAFIARIYGIGP